MRTALRVLLLAIALGATLPAAAKEAADYFHGAAYKFVTGRHQEASVEAEDGLRQFPGDAKLKALADHIRRMKNQQRQDQGSQGQGKSDQGKDDKDQEGKQGDQGQDDKQDQKDPQKDQKQGPEDDKGKDGQDAPRPESDDKGGKDSTGEAMAPVKPGEMSKEDAERLLNSIQDDEKKEHKQQQRRYRKKIEVEQDW
jgi:hypothetical protein